MSIDSRTNGNEQCLLDKLHVKLRKNASEVNKIVENYIYNWWALVSCSWLQEILTFHMALNKWQDWAVGHKFNQLQSINSTKNQTLTTSSWDNVWSKHTHTLDQRKKDDKCVGSLVWRLSTSQKFELRPQTDF